MTLDHIIPMAFMRLMGIEKTYRHDLANYQLLCPYCNFEKANHFDFRNPVTKELLFRYLGEQYHRIMKEKEKRLEAEKAYQIDKARREKLKEKLDAVKARNEALILEKKIEEDPISLGVEFDEFGFPIDAPLWLQRKMERKNRR